MKKQLAILGTRGIPARDSGCDAFAERLALHLVQQGWEVTVYCQGTGGNGLGRTEDVWQGVRRITFPAKGGGAAVAITFDFRSVRDVVAQRPILVLTLGYNSAVFCTWLRLSGIRNLINMDRLESRQGKSRWYEKAWLWTNERIGARVGDHLIASDPLIADHLATRVPRRKIATIPYGADGIAETDESAFQWDYILGEYESLLTTHAAATLSRPYPKT